MEAEHGGENHPHGDPLHPCAGIEDIPGLEIGHRLRRQGRDQAAERLEPFTVERRREQPAALAMLGGRQQDDRVLAQHLRQQTIEAPRRADRAAAIPIDQVPDHVRIVDQHLLGRQGRRHPHPHHAWMPAEAAAVVGDGPQDRFQHLPDGGQRQLRNLRPVGVHRPQPAVLRKPKDCGRCGTHRTTAIPIHTVIQSSARAR